MSRVVHAAIILFLALVVFNACATTSQKGFRNALDATVNIYCDKGTDGEDIVGWGSGVILDGGQILTAAHVVNACLDQITYITHRETGKVISLLPTKINILTDLALLHSIPIQDLGSPSIVLRWFNPDEGTDIYAIGYPAPDRTKLVTKGIVSGYVFGAMFSDVYAFFGNSGGPVVDKNGRLVGIMVGLNENQFGISNTVIVPIEEVSFFLYGSLLPSPTP